VTQSIRVLGAVNRKAAPSQTTASEATGEGATPAAERTAGTDLTCPSPPELAVT
jgi:hypothetical protein